MSYDVIPNLLYSGNPVYVKSPTTGGGALPQVPMGVEGQNFNSPRSVFLSNILQDRANRDDYIFYDENHNKLGQIMDIGMSPQTNNDSYFFSNDNQGSQKGQFDVIYYEQTGQQGVQLGGRRRKTRVRKGRKGRKGRTRRY
jgi:hypothetical protein